MTFDFVSKDAFLMKLTKGGGSNEVGRIQNENVLDTTYEELYFLYISHM